MDFFCKNTQRSFAVNHFLQKYPSKTFEKVLNRPLITGTNNVLYVEETSQAPDSSFAFQYG